MSSSVPSVRFILIKPLKSNTSSSATEAAPFSTRSASHIETGKPYTGALKPFSYKRTTSASRLRRIRSFNKVFTIAMKLGDKCYLRPTPRQKVVNLINTTNSSLR